MSGASKQDLGILATQGRLALTENPLLREWTKLRGATEAQGIHDALVHHAAELPNGEPLPHGYEYLKINRGAASAPYTDRIGGEFEHALDPKFVQDTFTRDGADPFIRESENGTARLVVPSTVKKVLEGRQVSQPGMLYQTPSSVWKHLAIGLRPASFVNISAGNSVLGLFAVGAAAWVYGVAEPGRSEARDAARAARHGRDDA